MQREESRIAVHSSFDMVPADCAFAEMVAHCQQICDAQAVLGVILKLLLSQMFHKFLFGPPPGDPVELHIYKLAKVVAYYYRHLNKSFQPSR